ncbi:MAG: PilT/PilU family type 4a pilus ATPase [Cellvibrionales bacterium]|nr:PilT/PilU family type 4a pilus ATPase [Cellvibrionales bacterium]
MELQPLLDLLVERDGSDLFIAVGRPPSVKLQGQVRSVGQTALDEATAREMVLATMEAPQREKFMQEKELNYALVCQREERFRVNAFFQMGCIGMVVRRIKTIIPTHADLFLPPVLLDLCMEKRGIVILVGGTGTGKSTSLAALISHRNQHSSGHIVTVEDPIEYIHRHDRCIVTQREIGVDTLSWENALENALRQAPDVILIGEIRDQQSMRQAIGMSNTGHLVLASLHANNANQAMNRVINFFPPHQRNYLLHELSLNLRGFVAQQLVPTVNGDHRAAVEVMINTPRVADLIRQGEVDEIKEIMGKSRKEGMQTFDQALHDLYREGVISYDSAIAFAESKNDLRLLIKLGKGAADSAAAGLELQPAKPPSTGWQA